MTVTRWPMRTSRPRRAIVAMLAALAVSCGTGDDGAVRLTTPPCDDEGVCAAAYEYNGRIYSVSFTELTDEDVAELEVERLEVAEGEGIDVLVTTDDPDVIYLHATDERWLKGHAE